ncbi:MAG: hypothetical protein NC099_02550 [Corallococcus sp.]|nr:hypothetical protein [Corallococcus sp.]
MKKRFALILGVIMAAALCLSACSNPTTTVTARWSGDESLAFNIELADFTDDTVNIGFKSETHEKEDYCKDTLVSSLESVIFYSTDEVRPVKASGQYVYNLTHPTTTECELNTKQTLYVQYREEYITALYCYEDLKQFIVAPDAADNPFVNHEGLITLCSVTETSVVFGNDSTQAPSKSSTKVHGFYLGKLHQGITDYEVSAEYNLSGKSVTVKMDDEEPTVYKLSSSNVIDANQILLYVRSLGKTADDFQNTPTVSVFNPYRQDTVTASFTLNRETNIILNNGGNCYVKLNAVNVVVNGYPYMVQYNVPDSLAEKSLDLDGNAISIGSRTSKYSTLRFRVGNFSYELVSHDPEIINALTAPKENAA